MSGSNPTFKTCVMFYGAGMLPRLRGMTRPQLIALTAQASDVAGQAPIHMHPVADLRVPLWSNRPLTGARVAALMSFGLWVLCLENESVAGPLLEAWPIREGVLLCDGPEGVKRVEPYEPPESEPAPAASPGPFPLFSLIAAAGARAGADD